MSENLHVEIHEGVAEVTLNRPRQRNALTFSMYERLLGFCEKATRDPSLRAVLITGAGDKAFAAGTDIAEFHSVTTADDRPTVEMRSPGPSVRVLPAAALSAAWRAGMSSPVSLVPMKVGNVRASSPRNSGAIFRLERPVR